jgi:hypothetical protein
MLGRQKEAEEAYAASANEAQDFKEMVVTSYSASTFYRGLSLLASGRESEAYQLFSALYQYGQQLVQLLERSTTLRRRSQTCWFLKMI